MFGHKVNPTERRKVLELLIHWSHAIACIDMATDAMRQTIVEQSLGMQSWVCCFFFSLHNNLHNNKRNQWKNYGPLGAQIILILSKIKLMKNLAYFVTLKRKILIMVIV